MRIFCEFENNFCEFENGLTDGNMYICNPMLLTFNFSFIYNNH